MGTVTLGFLAGLCLLSILSLIPPDIHPNAPPTEF